ncbi:MAG: DegT/DnrJ/EryC1/StrS family aminotransferase [Bacteroidales bacterium]
MKMQMVDLKGQYLKIKGEIDGAIQNVIDSSAFINGPQVKEFAKNLAAYNGSKHCITCANGTDALQIALMALGLQKGDEVIVPAFTYVSTAEVIGLLGLTPVMVDVDYQTFNITVDTIKGAVTPRTKAIVPVHLYGQSCDMDPIMDFARENGLFVVEDDAQAIGSWYTFRDGHRKKTGSIGHIGCTSFFPSKNLGCYGDGGAMFTDDDELAERLRMIANHGQQVKYHHKIIGCNSRLDTIQAAILDVKLRHLDEYLDARHAAAQYYTENLKDITGIVTPKEEAFSTHGYHQYTLKVQGGKRDALKQFLAENEIPSMIYYPLPLQEQEAFKSISKVGGDLSRAKELAGEVLSLPIHTEITRAEQNVVISRVRAYYGK